MATTITPSDLSVTLNDSITLNSNSYGGVTPFVVGGCMAADQRIVAVAVKAITETVLGWTNLFWYDTTNQQGQGVSSEFAYLRVTNLDTVNYILLNVLSATVNNTITVKLAAGESYTLQNGQFLSSTTELRTAYPVPVNIKQIKAASDTAIVDVEILTVFKPSA
jgi:hypothetical protein